MIDLDRQRDRIDSEKNSFLDKVFNERFKTVEKEKEQSQSLSLFEEIKSYDTSNDKTYNISKMSMSDKFKFLTTKNLKYAQKLVDGKLNEEKVNSLKLNSNDYIFYQIAQCRKGVITEKDLVRYAKETFNTKADRNNFINGAKLRLYALRSAGCVNDIGKGNYEKIKYNTGERKIEFYARKNISYQVTHIYKNKLDNFIEEAKQYRLNNHEKMILDSFNYFGTKDEVINHMTSFYSFDLESRSNVLAAQVWKLEQFGYIEKVRDTYFTNIDYKFNPEMDYISRQILILARDQKLNENTLNGIYEKSNNLNMDKEDIPFIADGKLAQLKFKEIIGSDNRLTNEGKELLHEVLDKMKENINKRASMAILESCIKDKFDRNEYKELLSSLYDEDKIKDLMQKAEYTIDNLKALKFINNNENITPEGLMFLEKSKYIPQGDRIRIKDIGYLEKQVLESINNGDLNFGSIEIGDLDRYSVENVCRAVTIDLHSKGYIGLVDGQFELTEQSRDLLFKDNYKITNFDTKNILDASKDGIFTFDLYKQYQNSLGKTDEEIEKGFNIISKRLESHIYNSMVVQDGDEYILSNDFINACGKNPGTVRKEFVLTDYDKNILNLIDKKVFSKEGVIKELKGIYGDDAERRYYVMRSRAKTLAKEGYVTINDKEFYSLTDTGLAVLNDYNYKLSYFDYKTFLETSVDRIFSTGFYIAYYNQRGFTEEEIKKEEAKIRSRMEFHINSGLLEKIGDDLYLITDKFIEKYNQDYLSNKEFDLGKFDSFILNKADKNVIDIDKYIEDMKNIGLVGKQIYNKERMFTNRLLLLEREGYVTKIDDTKYMVTGKHLVMRDKDTGERITLGKFDKQLYSRFKEMGFVDDGFTLDDIKLFGNDRDIRFFTGRCVKLLNNGYLIQINGNLFFSDRFLKDIEPKNVEDRKEIKINRFDVNRIYRCKNNDEIFSKKTFINNFMGNSEDLEKEWSRVEKRLNSLKEQGYILPLKDGEFELREKFLDECREHEKRLVRMRDRDNLDLNVGQRIILKELQTFLNISQTQFNRNDDFSSELKNLYDRGIIDYEYRVINEENTKVFYLTSEGKQITSKLTGVKTANIFSSKIHSRPEELEHDVLVYSAFQDAQIRLSLEGKAITKVTTDRDMRRRDNHVRMTSDSAKELSDLRVELSDLEIEYVDIKTGESGILNIEVDLGYSSSVIQSKAENIKNLVWYTNSDSQKSKIERVVPRARVIKL